MLGLARAPSSCSPVAPRVAKLVRRRLFRSQPEKAYDSLPKPMQSWVDTMAGTIGPRAAEARQSLSEELLRWRHDPKRNAKVSKKMAEEMAKGPAGPKRTAWTAFEAGAAILTAALARKAVERFLSGEPPTGVGPLDAVGTVGGAAEPDPKHAKNDVTKPPEQRARAAVADAREDYSGMSSRVARLRGIRQHCHVHPAGAVARHIAKVSSNGAERADHRSGGVTRLLDHRPAARETQAEAGLRSKRHEERHVDRIELPSGR